MAHYFPLFLYYSLTSTTDTARTLIAEGKERGLVVAYTQSKGRGNFGRSWSSPEGNFYGTLFFPKTPINPSLILYMMAHLIKKVSPYIENGLSFRWPNDLLFYDKKVGSVFLEHEGDHALIGININLKVSPEPMDQSITCLFDDPNIQIELPQFSDVLKEGLEASFNLPFAEVRDFCTKRLSDLKSPRTFNTKKGEVQGTIKGINENGCLLLKNPDGTVTTLSPEDLTN